MPKYTKVRSKKIGTKTHLLKAGGILSWFRGYIKSVWWMPWEHVAMKDVA